VSYFLETFRLGLRNLRLHMLRSFLTALGIILGVAAVIIMVSIGEGSKQEALLQLEQLGARNLIIRSERPADSITQQGGQQTGMISRYGLTRDDLNVLRENFPHAESIVALKEVGGQVLRADRMRTSQAFGSTPELLGAAGLRMARGRFLTQRDIDEGAMVAVIGKEVARALFPYEDPIGLTINIDDKAFTVVGVLAPVGLAGGAGAKLVGRDMNHDVHIPVTTANDIFGDLVLRRSAGSFTGNEVQVSEVYIVSPTRETVLTDAARLHRLMAVRHPDLTDVSIIVPYELLEQAKRTALTWQVVLGMVAGISLLVGGIGIMNIMLATVQERTREIGIRRAVGAKRFDIVSQFVVETGVLSGIGGVIGVLLGVGASVLLGYAGPFVLNLLKSDAQLHTQVTGWSIAVAFVVATITGLVFGIYPARQAAKQDPIVALRHD